LVYLRIYPLLPYERASEIVSDLFGHPANPATVVAIVNECPQNLTGVEDDLRKFLQNAHILHVDETGMRVGDTRQWLHVASTDLLTCYGHPRNRGAKATEAMGILPAFQGTAVHDLWAPYLGYACSHAVCNAHLLRELRGITENFGHQWSGALGNLLSEIKAAVDAAKEEGRVLTPEKNTAFEEQYLGILEAGKEELEVSGFHEDADR